MKIRRKVVHSFLLAVFVGLALFWSSEARAVCKLAVTVDRTASMTLVRANNQSKCFDAQNALILILDAYYNGRDFDITMPGLGQVLRPEFDANCPVHGDPGASTSTRLLQVWELRGDVMRPLWNGWLSVAEGYAKVLKEGWFDASGISLNQCPGESTPLAQTMCRVARAFPSGPSPAGEIRVVKTTTDGEENHSDVVPIDPSEIRCRNPGDAELTWRNAVRAEYIARGIEADAILWEVGGGTVRPFASANVNVETNQLRVGDVPPRTAITPGAALAAATPDQDFFQEMAAATSGRYRYVAHTDIISSAITYTDADQDGIPDFRDLCTGTCPSDADGDGIPDSQDICPFLPEDGRGPFPADGCPDTDADGVRNGLDQCPTQPEDGKPPLPADGCPTTAPPAAPAMPAPAVIGLAVFLALGGVSLSTALQRRRGARR